ncbi:MAG: SDR family oxidoreductase [Caldimonas sp.]
MKVLVCGSSGCVGRAVVQALRWRGHRVVEARHAPDSALANAAEAIALDFMEPSTPQAWAARLADLRIDVIVNCVGILMPSPRASFERVHTAGPIEMFRGAVTAGVKRVVQISALGVGGTRKNEAEPPYLRSKRLADDALLALDLDAAIVRPSLVYGPASQSATLFATLASLPVISLPGRGDQAVQPIHVFELAEAVAALVERTGCARGVYELGGAAPLTYKEMLATYRAAQGLGTAIWMHVPALLMRLGALAAERLPQKVFCRDTIRMLERGNVTSRNAAHVLLGRAPATLAEGLATTPPRPAVDLRVEIAAPVATAMRLALAFLWIYIAVISALLPGQSGVLDLLARCGFAGDAGRVALVLSCVLNLGLGLATLMRPSAGLYALQSLAVVGYTFTAAVSVPSLTIDHCGPLVKNVPILMFIVALWLAEAGHPAIACRQRRSPPSPAARPAAHRMEGFAKIDVPAKVAPS